MGIRFFSDKNRPVHMGPFPLENFARGAMPDLATVPAMTALSFRSQNRDSIVPAMGEYQAMLDAIRDGLVNKAVADIPSDPIERAQHIKAFGYFNDAAMIGICRLPEQALLDSPIVNPDINRLAEDLKTKQTKTLASGIDLIMADLRDSMEAPPQGIDGHTHAVVFLYQNPRDPKSDEPGSDWIMDAGAHRGALRANETAAVIGNYIRLLGFDAKSHSMSATDVDLSRLAVAAGLLWGEGNSLECPFLGQNFGLAAVTCTLEMAINQPLAPKSQQSWFKTQGPSWWLGKGTAKSGLTLDPFSSRNFKDGPHPFERLKRIETPTTYMDEANIPRVPKRTDMFARSQFGDMGKANQAAAKGGYYARKSAPSFAQRRALGAFVLIQNGDKNLDGPKPNDAQRNADNIKAACYFLGVDATGLSRCPDWAWYSHDAAGEAVNPPHDQAISMIIDQGRETMEGASGDDWIAVAQSMRAYLRFSLLGGVIAKHIRNLGYSAKSHTVMDGDVLQPPLLLLSGLGEVSRIGEVILNPYLGPRLKSGVVTTDMPMVHDQPIDFGLQNFCENCNKCARECPSGAITAGPKLMFNGYEIWKSDSQKCTTYRITNQGGAMCGRCMKTCPWNLEGLFAEAPFRWAAMNIPSAAPILAKMDDMVGNGEINPIKKWWWDIELAEDGAYRPARAPVLARRLQKELDLKYEDQTLAVYPAPLAPHPYPYPFPMEREKGIEAYQAMVTAEEHKAKLARGEKDHLHIYSADGESPVLRVEITKVEVMAEGVTKYEFSALDGSDLPEWTAGAHLDIVVAPEYLRQYSMSGNPADRKTYQISVLREDEGRGGSLFLHRIFTLGRKIFISKPINHFELVEDAHMTYLMGGGIGITPMIAFAHRLHALGRAFELHYSIADRKKAGFLDDLEAMPWGDNVHIHVSNEGSRADLDHILSGYKEGAHVYTCGPDRYMSSVMEAAQAAGFPEEACHLEYFNLPEQPDYVNKPFEVALTDGRRFDIPADRTATDVLVEAGVNIDVKCSDGLCGVCKCTLVSGEVEHRDYVLSKSQRETSVILCQSRAKEDGGTIVIDVP